MCSSRPTEGTLAGGENVFSFLNVCSHSVEHCCEILKAREGQQRVQHKRQQGVLMLSVLELSLYQFQHLDAQLVPCTDFSVKVKKKKQQQKTSQVLTTDFNKQSTAITQFP